MATSTDGDKWHKILAVLALNFNRELTPAHFELYDNLLESYNIGELESAGQNFLKDPEQKFMPNLNDFERALQGDPKGRANKAIERLKYAMSAVGSYESVVFQDKAITATVEHFGGWPEICRRWNETDAQSIGYLEHDFRNVYQGMLKRDVKVRYLPGQFEIHNVAHQASFERGTMPEVKVKLIPDDGYQRLALPEDLGEPKLIGE